MNLLFAASELAPYAKTGGLADVMKALPAALRARGHSVSVVVPLYRVLRENWPEFKRSSVRLAVSVGAHLFHPPVWIGSTADDVTIFAIEQDEFFDRSFIYGNEDGDYYDNSQRFAFFSQAIVELARYIEPQVEIIHLNDWHVGLVPAYVKHLGVPVRTLFTIHNLSYQGSFPGEDFTYTHLPSFYFSPWGVEFYGRLHFLKAALLLADYITTVSPGYAQEIQKPQYGCGLDRVLVEQNHKLCGILNGIDTTTWNPAIDPHLAYHYDASRLEQKFKCKLDLLWKLGFRGDEKKPLFGFIARLVHQKGVPLLLKLIEPIISRGGRIVILGQGQLEYQQALLEAAKLHPLNLKVRIGYDEPLAHQIEAGSDFFLMPSEFEPCGLNQLYSLRYGTIPIVHRTGGLGDSVQPWDGVHGTGFQFEDYTLNSCMQQIDRALQIYGDKASWQRIRKNAMAQDFSWNKSVIEYEKVYSKILKI